MNTSTNTNTHPQALRNELDQLRAAQLIERLQLAGVIPMPYEEPAPSEDDWLASIRCTQL